jgi:hypothetical protein
MQDWKTLLAKKAFRGFCLALVCYDLGTWCVIATLPVLIAERFDAAGALVLGLGIRILPRIGHWRWVRGGRCSRCSRRCPFWFCWGCICATAALYQRRGDR